MRKGINRVFLLAIGITILFVATGYALITNNIIINGTANFVGVWDVAITGVNTTNTLGTASILSTTNTDTTASFEVQLLQPGDKATLTIPIKNKGSIPAKIKKIEIVEEGTSAITYSVSGISEGDELLPDATGNLVINTTYVTSSSTTTDTNEKTISVIIDFEQQ